jgi:hypothetical protein
VPVVMVSYSEPIASIAGSAEHASGRRSGG